MPYIVPTDAALHFKFADWSCALWACDDPSGMGMGQELVLGYEAPAGWIDICTIWGMGDMATAVAAKGGMGNFLVPLIPKVNDACKAFFNTHPNYPPMDNSTPYSVENMNEVLYDYFKAGPSTDGSCPVIGTKPYP